MWAVIVIFTVEPNVMQEKSLFCQLPVEGSEQGSDLVCFC